MKIIFYHDVRSLNDATRYYIKLIETSAHSLNIKMTNTTKLNCVNKYDIIFTITAKYYFLAKIRYPLNKTMFWAQGVMPEEYLMSKGGKDFKFRIKEFIERISIRSTTLLFVVSKKMLHHYNKKYNYNLKRGNYIVMPCYNLPLEENLHLTTKRYESPSFVYAGSLSAWQCIDKTLSLFKNIQHYKQDATLTLLVSERDKALSLIEKFKLKNVIVKYVALNELQNELKKFKYGFLIRENNIVNNVATPTKMNSYLASGVIPIFTTAVNSFVENIDLGTENTICFKKIDDLEEMTFIILNHMDSNININNFINRIESIFEKYYNDNLYIKSIINKIEKLYL